MIERNNYTVVKLTAKVPDKRLQSSSFAVFRLPACNSTKKEPSHRHFPRSSTARAANSEELTLTASAQNEIKTNI